MVGVHHTTSDWDTMLEFTFHILRQCINNFIITLEFGRESGHGNGMLSGFMRRHHRAVVRGSVLDSGDEGFKEEAGNPSCKRPDSKSCGLCGPYSLCHKYSTLLLQHERSHVQ